MNEQNNKEQAPEAGSLYPATVEEMLKRWDNGDTIWSLEMGGLGPGYEQAIQIGMIEVCRKMQNGVLIVVKPDPNGGDPTEHYSDEFQQAAHEVDREFKLGLSGAQASAIFSVAYRFLTDGPRKALLAYKEMYPDDPERFIQVSNSWPGHAE